MSSVSGILNKTKTPKKKKKKGEEYGNNGYIVFSKTQKVRNERYYHSNFHLGQSLALNKFEVFFFFFGETNNLKLFLKPIM